MSKIVWDDRFSVGNDKIDDQHKSLVNLINQLNEIEEKGGQLSTVFAKLDHYVHSHFTYEEVLLERVSYEDFENHKTEHKSFENWLHSVKVVYSSAGPNAHYIVATVNCYLKDWLITHIMKSDMAFKGVI